jgi:predicted enzyme related to lactoylglutathione lyase
MSGPARAGALIYARFLEPLTAFYRELLDARVVHADAEYAVLQSADMQIVVHAMPSHIVDTVQVSSPPAVREQTAIKLFFTVPDISAAQAVIARHGGIVPSQSWRGKGFTAFNGVDPEGNVLQLRVFDGE